MLQNVHPSGVYNLADASDSSQASLAANLEAIFNIQTSFVGTIGSTAMKVPQQIKEVRKVQLALNTFYGIAFSHQVFFLQQSTI